ncbi:MAG: 4Fe-4S binding protein [Candidatus Bathyarchaeota archaeon]|nr:4Fe-4S binding protein [Candidatus Bathyarchaeota archaeon]
MPIIAELLKLTILAGVAIAGILAVLIWKKNLTARVTYLRFWIQITSVITIFYIYSVLNQLLFLLAGVFIMTIFLGRFFCGWFCPFGFYMDLITQVRRVFKRRYRKLPVKINGVLNRLRYGFLVFFLLAPLIFSSTNTWLWPYALTLSGPFRPLLVLLSPLEPLIIPWASPISVSGVNISYPYASDFAFYLGENLELIAIFTFIILTIIASLFVRRFWCRFCPTGISLAVVNRFKGFKWLPFVYLYKVEEKCTKCGICERVCPVQVTEVYEQKGGKINTSMCLNCFRCVEMCPYESCLKVNLAGKTLFKSRNWLEPAKTE